MAKDIDVEDVNLDMTSMIDVVFLLIIFFILMPPKEMEGQLQSYLPSSDSGKPPPNPEEPPPKFTITISSSKIKMKIFAPKCFFNNRPVCQFTTYSLTALDAIYSFQRSKNKKSWAKSISVMKISLTPSFQTTFVC